ncbi:hypothetical protein B0T22DRAFT_475833 [Podospora appendiculata]|uniref:Uncharacterized protein n=1 Tax=Podospora appendiculata TaxID=314037 RepID=A0AAE1CFU8_9PEZI|nr:hypothetical protein B0T22DRAFT_475833 [Podospora appendiculata]
MRFFFATLLASVAIAFTIPDGQPDGTYQVSIVNGKEVHTLITLADNQRPRHNISDVAHSAKFARRGAAGEDYLVERQISGGNNAISCGGGALNHGDTDAANTALDRQCGSGANVGGGRDFYSIAGCTVAYFCNFRNYADMCFASERVATSAAITSNCGWYVTGWDTFSSSGGGGRYNSYGYENFCGTGSNFCGRGTSVTGSYW